MSLPLTLAVMETVRVEPSTMTIHLTMVAVDILVGMAEAGDLLVTGVETVAEQATLIN